MGNNMVTQGQQVQAYTGDTNVVEERRFLMVSKFKATRAVLLAGVTAWAVMAPLDGVHAQTASTNTATKSSTANTRLLAEYSAWAGSKANATALITSLQTGSTVTLTGSGTTSSTSFTPVTGKLGSGEVNIALSLAKASLAQQGITNPTPAQLSAALNGGVVTSSTSTTSLAGVLTQRQSGSGWGEIAHSLGIKLGAVVSASKTDKSKAGASHNGHAEHHAGRPEHDSKHDDSTHSSRNASGSGHGSSHGGNSGGGKK
jgi:hypothetical protein